MIHITHLWSDDCQLAQVEITKRETKAEVCNKDSGLLFFGSTGKIHFSYYYFKDVLDVVKLAFFGAGDTDKCRAT